MGKIKISILFLMFLCQHLFAQADTTTVIELKQVVVATSKQPDFKSQQTIKINDSIIQRYQPLLGEALKNNSTIYFKEYGQGMLSTVSFRGTTASQTAVLWNGININSQLNGTTDFNTISTNGIQSIEVKAGGASILYGSGAIGGTVHINNQLTFVQNNEHQIGVSYGSFQTYGGKYAGKISTPKTSFAFGFSHFFSENNYIYKGLYTWQGIQRKNENGQYAISEFNLNGGYRIDSFHSVNFFSNTSFVDRNLALTTENDPKSKYRIQYTRNLIDYTYQTKKIIISPKMAYLTESYQYFPEHSNLNDFSAGEASTFLARNNLNVFINNLQLSLITDYTNVHGSGKNFGNHRREVISNTVAFQYPILSNWKIDGGLKNEITSNYKSPILFSLGNTLQFKCYEIKLNCSKNYRIPTFNDLYWEDLGNSDLLPEESFQGEISNGLKFKNVQIFWASYYSKIKQMIRWVPFTSVIWKPLNIDQVEILGSEIGFDIQQHIFKNHTIKIHQSYSYTLSENIKTRKQLTYTPFYRNIINFDYMYKNFSIYVQNSYTGKVYTSSDNSEETIIKPYWITNVGIAFNNIIKHTDVKINANNILNIKYTSIDRPMPGINFNFQLIYKM